MEDLETIKKAIIDKFNLKAPLSKLVEINNYWIINRFLEDQKASIPMEEYNKLRALKLKFSDPLT